MDHIVGHDWATFTHSLIHLVGRPLLVESPGEVSRSLWKQGHTAQWEAGRDLCLMGLQPHHRQAGLNWGSQGRNAVGPWVPFGGDATCPRAQAWWQQMSTLGSLPEKTTVSSEISVASYGLYCKHTIVWKVWKFPKQTNKQNGSSPWPLRRGQISSLTY